MDSLRFGFPGWDSTPKVGINSGQTAGFDRADGDGRFTKGNPWRWQKGQSGNRKGRPRGKEDVGIHATVLNLVAGVHEIRQRLLPQRDSRFEKFKVFYEHTGSAYRSARLAGYAPKTAKSKSYMLARRARDAEPWRYR